MSNKLEKTQLFTRLGNCNTLAEFESTIASIIIDLEFSDFAFIAIKGQSTTRLTSLPQELYNLYAEKGLAKYDLAMAHATVSTEPIYFSAVKSHIVSSPYSSNWQSRNKELVELFSHYGYRDCYCVPQTFPNNIGRTVFLITDKNTAQNEFQNKVEQERSLLALLVDAVAYFAFTKFPEEMLGYGVNNKALLTAKPLHLLVLIATEGLKLKEAAKKLCISLDTANKHIAVAKQSLGAATLAQAVYLASIHGLIKAGK